MTTTETTAEDKTKAWAEAAAASAEAQLDASDPPPKKFKSRLTCILSDAERLELASKAWSAERELEEFDDETKQIVQERKADRAEIENRKKKFSHIASTGREDRDIDCVEYVSLRQGRRWRVRLDTNQQYDESPLSDADRQAFLPMKLQNPDDPEDGQLALEDALQTIKDPDGTGQTEVSHGFGDDLRPVGGSDEDEDPSPADITDPESLIAAEDEDLEDEDEDEDEDEA